MINQRAYSMSGLPFKCTTGLLKKKSALQISIIYPYARGQLISLSLILPILILSQVLPIWTDTAWLIYWIRIQSVYPIVRNREAQMWYKKTWRMPEGGLADFFSFFFSRFFFFCFYGTLSSRVDSTINTIVQRLTLDVHDWRCLFSCDGQLPPLTLSMVLPKIQVVVWWIWVALHRLDKTNPSTSCECCPSNY